MKDMERAFKQSASDNKALFDQVQELSRSNQERTAERIKAEIKSAAEAGEFDKLATLTEELVKANSTTAAPKPSKTEEPQKPDLQSGDVMDLDPETEAKLRVWAKEQDEQGQYKRPWLNPEHPQNKRAMTLIAAVKDDPTMPSFEEKAAEVDRLMGVAPRQRQAPVLNPTVTGNRGTQSRTPSLTPAQKAVAEAMGVKPDAYAAILAKSPKKANGEMIMSYAVE